MNAERFMPSPIQEKQTPERREDDITEKARWFAGAFEAGGTMMFAINPKQTVAGEPYLETYPLLVFRDIKRPEFLKSLQSEFGGCLNPKKAPKEWWLRGYPAANLITDMESSVVSRKEMVTGVRNWLEAENREERAEIAFATRGQDRLEHVTPQAYKKVVADAAFVAGALDNRATIYPYTGHKNYPRVQVRSANKALLDALAAEYGGDVKIAVEAGSIREVEGHVVEAKRDTYQWIITNTQAQNLLRKVLPHLRIPPYEGWDKSISKEQKQERQTQVDDVLRYVKEELDQYAAGTITRLSTKAEIAHTLSLTPKEFRQRIAHLPAELRQQRRKIIQGPQKQKLTDEKAKALIEAITQEVKSYQKDTVSTLTPVTGWASKEGVEPHIIRDNVLRKLPEEIYVFRKKALAKQGNRQKGDLITTN